MSDYLARIAPRRGDESSDDAKIRALHREWLATEDATTKARLNAMLARLPWDERNAYELRFMCEMFGCEVGPCDWTVKWDAVGVWTVGVCSRCLHEVYRFKATDADIETAPLTRRAHWYPEAVWAGEVETIFARPDETRHGRKRKA